MKHEAVTKETLLLELGAKYVRLVIKIKSLFYLNIEGIIVHEAPATMGARKGWMHAALPLLVKSLFPCSKPMTPSLQWSKLTVVQRLTLFIYLSIYTLNHVWTEVQ